MLNLNALSFHSTSADFVSAAQIKLGDLALVRRQFSAEQQIVPVMYFPSLSVIVRAEILDWLQFGILFNFSPYFGHSRSS